MIQRREVWQGGYGFWKTRGIPKGVNDPIKSIATVISDVNNSTIAMIILDTTGIGNTIHDRIVNGVEAATGIPADSVLLGATHTHSGPDLQGLWGGASDNYINMVVDSSIAAVVEAYSGRREANLFASKGTVTNTRNRRGYDYVDDELFVMDIRDANTDARISTIMEFAAHTVTLGSDNLYFSSDFPHYFRTDAEALLGAPVMFVNGPIGDVSPTGQEGTGFERPASYGIDSARYAVETMKLQEQITGDIFLETKHYEHPLTNPLFLAAFQTGLTDCCYSLGEVGYELPIPLKTVYLRIGDMVQGVAVPGESLTRHQEPIKGAMVAPYRFFLGLTGGTLGYFVPTDEWDPVTGYEETISINKEAGDVLRDHLLEMIQRDNARQ
jgi:hypothetical protein